MSGRLDQSLDSIIDSQKKAKRETRRRKVGKPTGTTAPVGGVKKSTRPVKSAIKPATGAAAQARSSKIVVSGLVCCDAHHTSPCPANKYPSHSMSTKPRSRYVDYEAYRPWIPIAACPPPVILSRSLNDRVRGEDVHDVEKELWRTWQDRRDYTHGSYRHAENAGSI
jgi:hypothetical protein